MYKSTAYGNQNILTGPCYTRTSNKDEVTLPHCFYDLKSQKSVIKAGSASDVTSNDAYTAKGTAEDTNFNMWYTNDKIAGQMYQGSMCVDQDGSCAEMKIWV